MKNRRKRNTRLIDFSHNTFTDYVEAFSLKCYVKGVRDELQFSISSFISKSFYFSIENTTWVRIKTHVTLYQYSTHFTSFLKNLN